MVPGGELPLAMVDSWGRGGRMYLIQTQVTTQAPQTSPQPSKPPGCFGVFLNGMAEAYVMPSWNLSTAFNVASWAAIPTWSWAAGKSIAARAAFTISTRFQRRPPLRPRGTLRWPHSLRRQSRTCKSPVLPLPVGKGYKLSGMPHSRERAAVCFNDQRTRIWGRISTVRQSSGRRLSVRQRYELHAFRECGGDIE